MDVDQDINLLSSFTAYLSNLSSVEDITEEECNKYVNGITSKNIQLVQLVENLGPFLLHLDNDKREQGCLVLANILTLLPHDALSSMEVTFIARFLCERMKDHHSVIPAALKGTLAIAKMKNVDNGIAAEFFSTAFIHFYCQSQRHDDRNTFYQIICCFMETKTPELLAMGTDFVYGVISSMDGEKDPRNLMLLFTKLVPKFVTTFKLGHLTEETFEVLGCYFPVDFQPLSNDPAAITRVDLASALQPCLVAHPEFAEFAVPLALEKLVSSLPVAKADSLKLLIDSCAKFPAANLMSHVTMIWHTLRSEILTCVGDPELRDLCFKVLYSLVQNLSCSALDSDQMAIYNGLLNDIFLSMKGYMSDLSLSLFNPICKLLETVASASHSSCSFMLLKIVPVLTALTPKSSAESVTLLKVMSAFLLVCFQTQVLPEEWFLSVAQEVVQAQAGTLRLKVMPRNGNCLFQALLHQLEYHCPHRPKISVQELRLKIRDYLLDNLNQAPILINVLQTSSQDPQFMKHHQSTSPHIRVNHFIQRLGHNQACHGGAETIHAFCELFGCSVRVYTENGLDHKIGNGAPILKICHRLQITGAANSIHYDSVLVLIKDKTNTVDQVAPVTHSQLRAGKRKAENSMRNGKMQRRESPIPLQHLNEQALNPLANFNKIETPVKHLEHTCTGSKLEAAQSISYKALRIGLWNLHGCTSGVSQSVIEDCFEKFNLDVVILQESNLICMNSNSNKLDWYNSEATTDSRRVRGVSIVVKKNAQVTEVKYHSPDLLSIKLQNADDMYEIFGCYAPASGTAEAVQFFLFLTSKLTDIIPDHRLVVAGDFDGHIGSVDRVPEDIGTIGSVLGHEHSNDNGKELKDLAKNFQLQMRNTFGNMKKNISLSWSYKEDWRLLQNDSNKIVTLYLSALSSNNEEEVLEGAEGFIVILSLLTEEERAQFYSAIRNLLQKDSSSLPRIQILKCIKAAAHHNPEEVLNQLVEGTLQPNHGSEITTQEKGLTVLCYLADQEPFFSHLYTHIKSLTDTPSREGIGIFLSCFKNLAEVENIILPKSSTIIFALISGVLQMDCADDNFFKLLENFYHVANALMLHLNESDEAKLVIHFLPLLLNEVERSTPGAESREIKILFLLSSLLTRIRMPVDKSTTSKILKFCADLIFHATNEEVILHAARLIALLVNKASEPDANLELEQIQNYLLDKENSGNVSAEVDVAYLCKKAYLTGWIVKALLSRNHTSADFWIDKLINLLGHGVVENKLKAAEMFRIIVEDDAYFSIASHCNIKMLYRQRLFQCVPKLVELSKSASFKTSYLMAVLYQLNYIPSQVVNMYLSEVLPVLIETLRLESLEQLQLPALKIISSLLQAKSNLLQPHLGTFMTLFLNLAKSSPQMKIRMAALQCLFDCSLFEESVILPQKSTILQELIPCLDDKKRLVRREAVRTRSRWFLVGSPVG